jgi:ATP-dependent helicase/DNAse subunit B
MQAEFGHRKYRPQFFELDLVRDKSRENKSDNSQPERPSTDGYEITSPNNETIKVKPLTVETDKNRVIKITGDIDRVDMFTDDSGQRFLRVVDYKTFNTEFNARHAKYGVNTQMLWYLFALCEANEDIKPGGVSYTPAKISGAITTKMQLANILLMNHSQSGMYVKDEPSPKADNKKSKSAKTEASLSADAPENNDSTQKEMDEYLGYLTDILNAEVSKKYQMPSKFSDEFAEYKKECLDNLKDKIDLLFNGDITPLPLKYSKKIIKIEDTSYQRTLPCDYCKFKDICGHIDGYAEIPSEKAEKEAKEKAANSEIAANADKNNDKEEK